MNGCTADVGGMVDTDTLDGITATVADGSNSVTTSTSVSGMLSPGDRIRIEGSLKVGELVYSFSEVSWLGYRTWTKYRTNPLHGM